MRSTEIRNEYLNGWLDKLDNRTAIAREIRERYVLLTNDMGGLQNLSYQQRSLAERALWLEYWISAQERKLANNEELDIGKWVQATNGLQGIYIKLGLDRMELLNLGFL